MNVGVLTLHGCIRAHKQSWSLCTLGHHVHFLAQQIAPSHSVTGYDSVHLWNAVGPKGLDPRQLITEVKMVDPHVDVWHVHNEPNWIFRAVKENTKKPVIFDIHDWTSLREAAPVQKEELEEERYAIENADGFCVVSKGYLKKIREMTKKPSVLVYSMLPQWLFAKEIPGDKPGLVYEGGVKGKNLEFVYNYAYRNWAEFGKAVAEAGTPMYFYTANSGEDFTEYEHEKVTVYPPEVFDALIRRMASHTAGLVGTPYPLREFEDSMPNKLFEYISAGIPVMVINAPEAARFVEEHNLGASIQDASQVPQALEQLKGHNVHRDRWGFTMESQIPKLLGLYEEVLCTCSPRVIKQMGS